MAPQPVHAYEQEEELSLRGSDWPMVGAMSDILAGYCPVHTLDTIWAGALHSKNKSLTPSGTCTTAFA